MPEVRSNLRRQRRGMLNGTLNEGAALIAVGDHLTRIAGWTARLRQLNPGNVAHREQVEALRVAVRISRSEFLDIEGALPSRGVLHPHVSEARRGYAQLADGLSRIAA